MTRMDDAVVHDLAAVPATPPIGSIEARARRSRRRRWTASVVFAVVALMTSAVVVASLGRRTSAPGVVSVSPTTAPAREAVCVHHPTTRVRNSYYGLAAPRGTSIDFRESVGSNGNTIRQDGLAVVRQGPGGIIRLVSHRPDGEIVYRGVGDFDGDGRSDVLVDSLPEYDTYVVPGTLASGTYDPAVVGFPVPQQRDVADFPAVVGDQNRDGADDISRGPFLYSGRAITANHGKSSRVRPFRTLPAAYRGLLQIDPGAPPSFVVPHPDGDGTAHFGSLDVLDRRSDRLLLDGLTFDETEMLVGPTSGVSDGTRGWLVHGHHIVDYGYGSRSGSTYLRFDLDAPCAK